MTKICSEIAWHDLRWDSDDLPLRNENVIITIETVSGERRVIPEAFWLPDRYGNTAWASFDKTIGDYKIWETVIAWAYYPDPYIVD